MFDMHAKLTLINFHTNDRIPNQKWIKAHLKGITSKQFGNGSNFISNTWFENNLKIQNASQVDQSSFRMHIKHGKGLLHILCWITLKTSSGILFGNIEHLWCSLLGHEAFTRFECSDRCILELFGLCFC